MRFSAGSRCRPTVLGRPSTGQDDLVKVWDIRTLSPGGSRAGPPSLLDQISVDLPSDAAWVSPDRLAVFLADAVEYVDVSLSVDGLVAEATQRLTRSFTIGECAPYQIEPCPTLEEIGGR
jgi:hypothetical protein